MPSLARFHLPDIKRKALRGEVTGCGCATSLPSDAPTVIAGSSLRGMRAFCSSKGTVESLIVFCCLAGFPNVFLTVGLVCIPKETVPLAFAGERDRTLHVFVRRHLLVEGR
jgi:hypothetical protein